MQKNSVFLISRLVSQKSIFKIHKNLFSFLLHKFLSNTLDFAFCLANSKTVINIYRKIFLTPILGDYYYFLS